MADGGSSRGGWCKGGMVVEDKNDGHSNAVLHGIQTEFKPKVTLYR